MDWDFYSSLIEEDVFSSFLHINEPMYELVPTIEPEKPAEVLDSNLNRLVKNRESARNTRKKKKQQLEFLEKRVAELTEEVEILRQETKSTEEFQQLEITQKYKSDKQILFDRLEVLLNSQANDEDFKAIIETLRVKMGASGVERQGYIEYLFHQISDISLPIQIKSLLSLENNKSSYIWEEMLDLNDLSVDDHQRMDQYATMISQKSQEFKGILKKLKRIKKCLLRRTGHLQSIIDYISAQLNSMQIAALLVRISKENQRLNPWNDNL